jgi:hypothetical protein
MSLVNLFPIFKGRLFAVAAAMEEIETARRL